VAFSETALALGALLKRETKLCRLENEKKVNGYSIPILISKGNPTTYL
jgi:hypothetical protein